MIANPVAVWQFGVQIRSNADVAAVAREQGKMRWSTAPLPHFEAPFSVAILPFTVRHSVGLRSEWNVCKLDSAVPNGVIEWD